MLSIASLHRFGWVLCFAVLLSACQGKKKTKQPVPELCQKAHEHVMALMKAEVLRLKNVAKNSKSTEKEKKKSEEWSKKLKGLLLKKGKARALERCAAVFKKKRDRILCTLSAKDIVSAQGCFSGKKEKSAPVVSRQPVPRPASRRALPVPNKATTKPVPARPAPARPAK